MTHMGPSRDEDGAFSDPVSTDRKCHTCKEPMTGEKWESHDGAFEDWKYTCTNGHVEWVDGIDS